MADREKVIKALEIFRDSNPYELCSGREFRAMTNPDYCMGQMIEDALELLKELPETSPCKRSSFVLFHGANKEDEEFVSRGPVCINLDKITAFYDHTIIAEDGLKLRVMESIEEIAALVMAKGEQNE